MYVLNVTLPLGKTKLHAHYCDKQGGFTPFVMLYHHSGKVVVLNKCLCLFVCQLWADISCQPSSLFVLLKIYFLTHNYIHSFSTTWSAKCALCYQTLTHPATTGTQHNNIY